MFTEDPIRFIQIHEGKEGKGPKSLSLPQQRKKNTCIIQLASSGLINMKI